MAEIKINLDLIYPVGSIYMNIGDTIDPNVVFGGTWELIKNRFLIGAGDEYSIEATGGEKTHKLTTSEIPKHRHPVGWVNNGYGVGNDGKPGTGSGQWDYLKMHTATSSTNTNLWAWNQTEGDQPHNNMPPYLAVAIWKRVA